jgi:predicted DNA-binding transcriptional regulator YafY
MRTGFSIEPTDSAQRIVLICQSDSSWITDSLQVEASQELSDGSVRIQIRADQTDWLVPILVNGGDGVRIEEPADLRDRVIEVLRATLANYS